LQGMPLLMYHGTPKELDKIEPQSGMIWLSSSSDYAKEFATGGGKVHEMTVNIENPFDAKKFGSSEKTLDQWKNILEEEGVDTSDMELNDWAPEYGRYAFYDLLPHAGNNYNNGEDNGLISALQDAGYDGIRAPEESQGEINSGETYVAFSGKQLFPAK
jgi:hypothetical protein